MNDANREQLITAARFLRPLLTDLVFVGGVVTGLLITDEAAAAPRPTLDVDAIAAIGSYAEYAAFGARLRALGFEEDSREGAPVCRWVHHNTTLDIMPLDEKILGFSNHWYRAAMDYAVPIRITAGLEIRVVTAPFFLATKLEAFRGRGKRDFAASRDLEDVISVVDGREELITEVQSAPLDVREYLAAEIKRLLQSPRFLDALPGHLLPDSMSQARVGVVTRRLEALSMVQ